MSRYFTIENLWRASALGLLTTAMAYPWITLGGMANPVLVVTTALGMILVAGSATAWGDAAGMVGYLPLGRIWKGVIAGVVAGAVVAVLLRRLDLMLHVALSDPSHTAALALAFPQETGARVASVLWVAGLETLLFEAGPVSFFARLTHRREVAIAWTALLRGYVAYRQALSHHIDPVTMVPGHMALSATGALLFAWGGLPAASAFAAVVTLRLFW